MIKDIAILSVAFGPRYIEQQHRLNKSLQDLHPGITHYTWSNTYPEGSRSHEQSLYGFKVHAVKHALQMGHRKIVWLDTAMICQGDLSYYFDDFHPVVAVKDDNPLERTISDKAIKYYGEPEIIGWHLVGGSMYCFDFDKEITSQVFQQWEKSEQDGIFGSVQESVSEQINKHRHDESCMSVALYSHGLIPVPCDQAKYNNANAIFIKKHFK